MRKATRCLLVMTVLFSMLTLSLGTNPSTLAQGDSPESPNLIPRVFLPLIRKPPPIYTVTGKVTDPAASPLAGVTVKDSSGHTAVTDAGGNYALNLIQGQHSVAAYKAGYTFAPSVVDLNVNTNLSGQNFNAACMDALAPHGGFETGTYWLFPASALPAGYDVFAHTGSWGVRTGGANTLSYSSVRSAAINIPGGTTSATLNLWVYQVSSEPVSAPLPAKPLGPSLAVTNPDGPTAPNAYDAQYILILDSTDNLLEVLSWQRVNDPAWRLRTFDLSKWAGTTIKIQVGTYNDGADGFTSMYVDDMSLALCTIPVPPPPVCSQQVVDPSFELNNPAWVFPVTAWTASRTTTPVAHSGVWSAVTGIPLTSPYDVTSYSEVHQTVSVPPGTTYAQLNVWLWPQTEEPWTPSSLEKPRTDKPADHQPLGDDAQYIIVYNPTATGGASDPVYRYLLWEKASQNHHWINRVYDLTMYAGKTVTLIFGVYNDGDGYSGQTVMYVDDVYLNTCTGTPPPPPVVCSERVGNGGFENNSSWYIPATAFSAGYSSFLQRTGLRSMRSGIYYLVHNTYSYSDFGQSVYLPGWADTATLTFYEYSMSGDWWDPSDVQYLLVLDMWGNWIDTLLWQRENDAWWEPIVIDLSAYIGWTIKLQWGTYNNGYGGVSSMYVDDVSLRVCPPP